MKKAIAKFEKYLKRRYPERSTAKHYSSDLKIFHQFVGEKSPREIGAKTIDNFIQAQQAEGLKATTINRRLATLSHFFDFLSLEAEADDWLNPVRWKWHRVKQGRHLPRDLKDETVETLLAVIDEPRDRAMFILMLKAGLRVGEVTALDVNCLEVPGQDNLARVRVYGKGQKERIALLSLESWLELQGWLEARPESEEAALFLNQHGRRMSVSGVQYRLKQYSQRAGVQFSCHQLRHTYARRLAERDLPLDSLAKLMGHNSLQATQRYIDGADPVVRRDFEQAMQGVSQPQAALHTPDQKPFAPEKRSAKGDERPDEATLLQELSYLTENLSPWLQEAIQAHMRRRMAGWPTHQLRSNSHIRLSVLRRVCGWLQENRNWQSLPQLQRQDLLAYVDHRLTAGLKANSLNTELTVFRGFWRELIEREQVSNGALLLVKTPAAPNHLPRYLQPEQFQRLLETLHDQTAQDRAIDYFDRAWFYLLAHAGLRLGEVRNLRLDDCDLSLGRLRICAGKGDQDRVVPMTTILSSAIAAYLNHREAVAYDHLLIHRGEPLKTSLLPDRLRRLGEKAAVEPISPHRLRHTLATLLVEPGDADNFVTKISGTPEYKHHLDLRQGV